MRGASISQLVFFVGKKLYGPLPGIPGLLLRMDMSPGWPRCFHGLWHTILVGSRRWIDMVGKRLLQSSLSKSHHCGILLHPLALEILAKRDPFRWISKQLKSQPKRLALNSYGGILIFSVIFFWSVVQFVRRKPGLKNNNNTRCQMPTFSDKVTAVVAGRGLESWDSLPRVANQWRRQKCRGSQHIKMYPCVLIRYMFMSIYVYILLIYIYILISRFGLNWTGWYILHLKLVDFSLDGAQCQVNFYIVDETKQGWLLCPILTGRTQPWQLPK